MNRLVRALLSNESVAEMVPRGQLFDAGVEEDQSVRSELRRVATRQTKKATFVLLVGSALCAEAGEPEPVEVVSAVDGSDDCRFCDALTGLASPIYKSEENPFIQDFRFTGRFHYQWGQVVGTSNGESFNGGGGEIRRLWGGVKFKAFNRLDVLATGRFSEQGFRNHDIQYNEIDFLSADFRIGDIGPIKNAKLGFGRYRLDFGREWHISANTIRTPERSPIFDRFIQPRATAVRFKGDIWGLNFTLNYATATDSRGVAEFNSGEAFHFATKWKALGGEWFADGYVVYADEEDDELFNFDKAFSLAYEWKAADWTMFVNGVWGDVGSEQIWGVVGMAHRLIYKDKVEAVLRYQFAGASDDLIRIGGRASRNLAGIRDLSLDLGDVAQNAYVGLNFYGCGFGSKQDSTLLVGLEWDKVTGSEQDFEALTLWTNYRIYF